jgi:hypothetical protein
MCLERPWELIILKVWAKRLGGYKNLFNAKPFEFTESFSNSNWKYYNLSKEGLKFLTYYEPRHTNGKIILKTKNASEVTSAGLIKNQASYELVRLVNANKGTNEK